MIDLFLLGVTGRLGLVRTWLAVGVLTWLTAVVGVQVARGTDVPPAVLAAEREREAIIEQASRSAVSVFGVGEAGGGGAAVVITADGYALTNFHVVNPVGNHLKCGLNDGRLYDAVVVGVDPTGDVALIKLLGRDDFPAARMGNSDDLRVGQWCFAVGNPFLLATNFQPTVTYGIVSGVHRYQYPAGTLLEYADCIQTDAAINPGNSGGPLFDAGGRLVGINGRGSFEKRGRVNVGVGYAISINQIKNFMGYLRSGRIVDHATLGASVATDSEGSVVVTNILSSSDAYRRGLRYGDEIVAFGGRPVGTTNAFKNVLGIFPRGWRVPLSYRRQGERRDIVVRLAGVHSREELIEQVQSATPSLPVPRRPVPDRDPNEPPRQPAPQRRSPPAKGDPEMPVEVRQFFEARRGFANYHFNRRNQERIWSQSQRRGDFTAFEGPWNVQGEWTVEGNPDRVPIRIVIDDQSTEASWEENRERIDFSQSPPENLKPTGSGGLWLALHQWRRLLTRGVDRYGDVYYLGTAPWPATEQLADVLVGTHEVVETRFYFDRSTGRLLGLEMYPDSEVDPCELYFREYHDVEGRELPLVVEVVHGDERFATLRLENLRIPATGDET
jgi:S1-C subfamily serine protease